MSLRWLKSIQTGKSGPYRSGPWSEVQINLTIQFSDFDLYEECADVCLVDFALCLQSCGSDPYCHSNCSRDEISCLSDCPCESNCPNGCDGCDNHICTPKKSVLVLSTFYSSTADLTRDFHCHYHYCSRQDLRCIATCPNFEIVQNPRKRP